MAHGPTEVVTADVLIIGTEAAGARAAIAARETGASVIAVSKYYKARAGATICAPSDYACDSRYLASMGCSGTDPDDSTERFYEDLLATGGDLNTPSLASRLVSDAGIRLADLIRWGARLGPVFHYPGHRSPRSLTLGDPGRTGSHLMQILWRRASSIGVRIYEMCMVLDLVVRGSEVRGAIGLDYASGSFVTFNASAVVICTGGATRLFGMNSTAPEGVTGDGMALAFRAGATLVDMEMIQFIPYSLLAPRFMRGDTYLAGELLTLAGAHLLNSRGERFMAKYQPIQKEKATRDEVSLAIAKEVAGGHGSRHGGAYVSVAHLDPAVLVTFLDSTFPDSQVGGFSLSDFGFDPRQTSLEVAPFAHYWCGGVAIAENGATSVPGLYAAGETAGGIHGANRLSGCSLTETQVFGAVAGGSAATWAKATRRSPAWAATDEARSRIGEMVREQASGRSVPVIRRRINRLAQAHLGVIRSAEGLSEAESDSHQLRRAASSIHFGTLGFVANLEFVKALESLNLIDVLEVTVQSALARRESRGSHYRLDFQGTDPRPMHTAVHQRDGESHVSLVETVG